MTTHDEHVETTTSTPTTDIDASATEESRLQSEPSAAHAVPSHQRPQNPSAAVQETGSSTAVPESATAQPEPATTGDTESAMTGDTESSTDETLFAHDDLSGLRSRWDEVQAAFVDDPRQCVESADALVSEVVERLTTGFSEARSRLEAQWARGEEASTEDLRLALKRYREFFQRLLSV